VGAAQHFLLWRKKLIYFNEKPEEELRAISRFWPYNPVQRLVRSLISMAVSPKTSRGEKRERSHEIESAHLYPITARQSGCTDFAGLSGSSLIRKFLDQFQLNFPATKMHWGNKKTALRE
jgi:hypothetical protein